MIIRIKETTDGDGGMFAKVRLPVSVRKQSGWLCGTTQGENRTRGRHTNVGRELWSRAPVVITSTCYWYPGLAFLDWTVGPIPSRRVASVLFPSPRSDFSLSFFHARIYVHTRAQMSVGQSLFRFFCVLLSFRVCCCYLHLHPRSLFLFFSRYPAGSRRAQMRLSRQRAVVGDMGRVSFFFLALSLVLRSPDISPFCRFLTSPHRDSFTSLAAGRSGASSFIPLLLM